MEAANRTTGRVTPELVQVFRGWHVGRLEGAQHDAGNILALGEAVGQVHHSLLERIAHKASVAEVFILRRFEYREELA